MIARVGDGSVRNAARTVAGFVAMVAVSALLGACGGTEDPPASDGGVARGEALTDLREQAQTILTRYAASPDAPPPSWDPLHPPAGRSIESAAVTASGTQLTVNFVGAEHAATEPCGIDYSAEVVESTTAVAVIVVSQHHADGEICTLVGFARSAPVNLARPLGRRAVLEITEGRPVPVSRG